MFIWNWLNILNSTFDITLWYKPVIFRSFRIGPQSIRASGFCLYKTSVYVSESVLRFFHWFGTVGRWDTVKSCASLHQFISSTFWFGKAFCFRSLDDSLSVPGFSIEVGLCVRVFGAIIPWNFLKVNIYLQFWRLTFVIVVASSQKN